MGCCSSASPRFSFTCSADGWLVQASSCFHWLFDSCVWSFWFCGHCECLPVPSLVLPESTCLTVLDLFSGPKLKSLLFGPTLIDNFLHSWNYPSSSTWAFITFWSSLILSLHTQPDDHVLRQIMNSSFSPLPSIGTGIENKCSCELNHTISLLITHVSCKCNKELGHCRSSHQGQRKALRNTGPLSCVNRGCWFAQFWWMEPIT